MKLRYVLTGALACLAIGATLVSSALAQGVPPRSGAWAPAPLNTAFVNGVLSEANGGTGSSTTISVKSFGAVGDGVTDDTAAINLAFDSLRTVRYVGTSSYGYLNMTIVFPPGTYRVTSINATGLRDFGWTVQGDGAFIFGTGASNVVFDATWSRTGKISGLTIYGDSAAPPRVGLQIGRKSTTASADGLEIDNVTVTGTYTLAALYNAASEDTLFTRVQLINDSTAASTFALVQDGANHWGITSAYQTIAWTADTAASFNGDTFLKLDARRSTSGGPVIWMSRTEGHKYIRAYLATAATEAIDLYNEAFANQDLDLDVHIETSTVTSCIKFLGTNLTPTMRAFRYFDYAPQCATQVFEVAGTTTVTLNNAQIDLPSFGVVPSSGVFDSPSKVTLHGRLNVGSASLQTLGLQSGWTQSEASGNSQFTGSYFLASASGNESIIGFEARSGAATKKRGRIVYNAVDLAVPGWVFQDTDDSGGFLANLVTISRAGSLAAARVGIGVLDPTVTLDVAGQAKFTGTIQPGSTTFAGLGTPANGQITYCSDCTKATPCAGVGTGALAKRLNGAWDCN